MAAGGSAGTLYVTVAAKTDKLESGMRKGRREVSAFTATTNKALGAVVRFGSAMAGAFAAQVTIGGLMRTAEGIDKIAKSADRLGATTEALVGLRHGAELSGVSADQLNTALNKFNRTIGDAKLGLETATRPLATLGINLRDIINLPLEQQLGLIADRFNEIESPADRTRVAMELFGRSGAGMISVLKEGSEGIQGFIADAEKLGLTFSREEAAKVEEFNDQLDRLKKSLSGAIQGLVIDISPAAVRAVNNLADIMGVELGGNPFESVMGTMTDDMFGRMQAEIAAASKSGNITAGELDAIFARHGFATAERTWGDVAMGRSDASVKGARRQQYLDAFYARIEANKKALSDTKTATGRAPVALVEKQLGKAATMAADTAKNIAKLGKDGAAALGLGAKWNELQRAALLAPFKASARVKVGADEPGMVMKQHQAALTLARSGSVESYRQRAAIARQNNPMLEIGKKQLKAGERTAVAVEQIAKNGVALMPANLKGG